jgi:hypothetical protein
VDGYKLSKGTSVGKARLELMIADQLVARQAGNAMVSAGYKGHGNPLA